MKVISRSLPREHDLVEIHLFADEHIGDACCDLQRLRDRIGAVANTPNAYCILNGDILDFATRDSIGDAETRTHNIMGQIEKGVELLEPIKDKILLVTTGNHEQRAFRKDGIDVSKLICTQLGIGDIYSPTSAFLFLSVGKGQPRNHNQQTLYTFYCLHGCGGGRKEGAKAIRLADMASICDADIYIHSHTHLPMVMKQGYFRVDNKSRTVGNSTKLFVNTASNLDYGGYGEAQEYKPNSKDTPTIYLEGARRKMYAKL